MPFDRPSEQKCAEHDLLEAVLMFRHAGLDLRDLLELAKRMWEHPHEETIRLQKWIT